MTVWRDINITDGTSQNDRHSHALDSGYFNVDELMFEELLAMGSEFASVINFTNLKNETDGNWGDMFSADEAVIMAMIHSTNLKKLESDFLRIPIYSTGKLAFFLLNLAKKINFWYTKLNASQHKSGEALAQKIAAIINERLVIELHNVAEIIFRLKKRKNSNIDDFSMFDSVWRLTEKREEGGYPKSNIKNFENIALLNQQLRSSFYVLFNSISYLKTITPIFLQESLGSQQHNPAIGMFMVFLKLYGKAQQKLNTFTERHLNFYYDDILRIKNRGQVPESVYLQFEAQPGIGKALIEKNTPFSAGKDESYNEVIYCADTDLVVTDAKVQSLATLYLQHDKLISPESELGYVTRIKSATPQLPDSNLDAEQLVSWPLFGAGKQGDKQSSSVDACMGFSVASPLLLLNEGVRKVEIGVELDNVVKIDVDTMVSDLLKSRTEQVFTRQLGKILARYLLTNMGCLTLQHKNSIISKAEFMLSRGLAEDIDSVLSQDWQGLFYKLFKKIFCIKLTTENGWLDVDDYIVVPYSENETENLLGFRILLSLGQEEDPVTPYVAEVHGGALETTLPVFQCHINPQANFYPYSVFQDLIINTFEINVDVQGVRNILAYNQHGQLDPSKPFHPFGPRPSSNSYFVFGNYELARKKLVDLNVNLEWGELPRQPGGFGEYYREYETQYSNSAFKGEFSALLDSSWQPKDRTASPTVNLFRSEVEGSRVSSKNELSVNVLDYNKPIDPNISEEDFQYSLKARNGFIRLSLTAPDSAFGHAEHPELLTNVLSANVRLKKPKPTPNSPYTPSLNRISLDYKASSTINLAKRRDEKTGSLEKIIHMHPFGVETAYPSGLDKPCFFMPQYGYEGNLFIGLSAKDISGNLSFFFHLSDELGHESSNEDLAIDWFYLASNCWKAMPAKRILSDTTNGFITSGIVTLDMPNDINRNNTVMPAEYFWLRVSASHDVSSFCRAFSVQTHAVRVVRKSSANSTEYQTVPDTFEWSSIAAIPGVGSIEQVGTPFGGRPKESDVELKTRVSERLRHKNRAQVPWDYERLVLERFRDVHKVKCFSNISSVDDAIKPGHVLIVVVPNLQSVKGAAHAKVMMSTQQLSEIKAYVKNISSPFAEIEVRNPDYELVQVRCTVKFVDGISDGVNINRLNKEITDYISPWNKKGYTTKFGWSIRQKDVESYIRNLRYVDFVTNFSMLHITVDSHGNYSLLDTARNEIDNEMVIRPRYPWSLAVPVRRHFIETMQTARSIRAEITGVDELEVGGTFIISGNSDNGEEE